jgi:hypothetical protein
VAAIIIYLAFSDSRGELSGVDSVGGTSSGCCLDGLQKRRSENDVAVGTDGRKGV